MKADDDDVEIEKAAAADDYCCDENRADEYGNDGKRTRNRRQRKR